MDASGRKHAAARVIQRASTQKLATRGKPSASVGRSTPGTKGGAAAGTKLARLAREAGIRTGVLSAEVATCEAEHTRSREQLSREASFMLSVLRDEVRALEEGTNGRGSTGRRKHVASASPAQLMSRLASTTALLPLVHGRPLEETLETNHAASLEAQLTAANVRCADLERRLASSEGKVASGEALRRSLEARLMIAEESSQLLSEGAEGRSLLLEEGAAAARLAELASSLSEMAAKYDDAQARLDEAVRKLARADRVRQEERQRQLGEVQNLQAELERLTRSANAASAGGPGGGPVVLADASARLQTILSNLFCVTAARR